MPEKSPNDSLQLPISFEIKIGGNPLPKELVIMKIFIKSEVNKISRAYVSILGGNSYENSFVESENTNFEPGKEITIALGYSEKNTVVFSGILIKHKLEVAQGYLNYASRSLVILEAADKAIKLTVEKTSELYENKKDSDIINTIISTAGVMKDVEATKLQHDFISRYDSSDWEIVLNRAKANGMLVFNELNKIIVATPKVSGTEQAVVIYGKDAYSFHAELNAPSQYQQLEAINYDVYNESEVKQNASEPSELDKPGNIDGKKLGKVTAPTKLKYHVGVPIQAQELKAMADAVLINVRLRRVVGELSFRGMTNVHLGDLLKLEGFGKLFNGLVYITGVDQRIENGEFVSRVAFGLKDDWVNKIQAPPSYLLKSIGGLHVGIVKKIDGDPDKKNRIKVMIPSLKNSGEGLWALLGHTYAGDSFGSFFIPEVNAEVIVGFLGDDPRFPVVLGSLYSKNNKPEETFTKENNIKSILTKGGVRAEFDDKNKAYKIVTPGKNSILVSDKSKGVEIEDQNGNIILTSSKGISLTSKKDIILSSSGKIEIKGDKGVSMIASTGDVSIEGKNLNAKAKAKAELSGSSGVDIKSSGVVNIKGSMINVN